MNLDLTARLMSLTNSLSQSVPKIDLQARRQRFLLRLNQDRPANFWERCIFNIFAFGVVFPILGLSFIFNDRFRERVYYLYDHPDHDDSLCLYPYLKWRHPYVTRWIIYLFPKVQHIWQKYQRFSRELKALIPTYKSSPPILGFSPKLAIVVHGAGEWAEDLKIPYGCIRLHYSPSFEDGRYQTNSRFEPMLAIDLPVTRAGVDLDPLYKKWGLESVAFIVDNVFRPIFKPADSRVLSPTAAYDLSKNFTKPIRVFEPEVSKFTINNRRVHYPLFLVGFFFISLLGLICGEPTDRMYMCNLYGPQYADVYECLSRWSTGPRNMAKTIFHVFFCIFYGAALFLGAIAYSIFAFTRVVGKAVVTAPYWCTISALTSVRWTLKKCAAILESVSLQILDAISLGFSLQWKTWAIAIPACWMLYLELRQMAVG